MVLPAFLKWQGAKNKQAANIVPLFDELARLLYVEPFGGSGAIFFNKEPEPFEVYNDLNSLFANLFRVIRSKEGARQLSELAEVFPMAREFWKELREICRAKLAGDDQRVAELIRAANLGEYSEDVVLAWGFFYCQNTGFGGNFFMSYGGGGKVTEDSKCFCANTYRNKCGFLKEFGKRFETVQIENVDAFECLEKYDAPETLFYIDPPYDVACSADYKTNWTLDRSRELVKRLKKLEGSVVLSCYDSDLYQELFQAGYERKQFAAKMTICSTKREERVETVYYRPSSYAKRKQEERRAKTLLF